MNIKKRFKSCFISDVEFHDDKIILKDCSYNAFVVYINDTNVMIKFKQWFNNVYMSCIPQLLTIFEYELIDKNDSEVMAVVKNIIFKPEKQSLKEEA